MLLVIQKGCVIATHASNQDVCGLYPGCLILTVSDDTPVKLGQTWDIDLGAAKKSACQDVDATAEMLRATVLTPGDGQMAEYQRTREEALAVQADADWQALYTEALSAVTPDVDLTATDYPKLSSRQATLAASGTILTLPQTAAALLAEATATYPFLAAEQAAISTVAGEVTLVQVAQAVIVDMAASDASLAAIKQARRAAKLRIQAATDSAGVVSARDAASWPETDAKAP